MVPRFAVKVVLSFTTCTTTFVYVSDVIRTFQLPLGQVVAELGVAGGGIVTVNVIWPLCGVIVWTGPVTFWFRRSCFDDATTAVGLDGLVPHELRHTAASLAIAAGASVKGVQAMLGHASATLTLDRYGHLFGDELDAVADRMDAARSSADFRGLAAGPNVIALDARSA